MIFLNQYLFIFTGIYKIKGFDYLNFATRSILIRFLKGLFEMFDLLKNIQFQEIIHLPDVIDTKKLYKNKNLLLIFYHLLCL